MTQSILKQQKINLVVMFFNQTFLFLSFLLDDCRLGQLSYADTHPMFTRKSYPNFFRIVPSENAFNAPRVKLLQAFNWTRVGTLYQNEPRFALVTQLILSFHFKCFFGPDQLAIFDLLANGSTGPFSWFPPVGGRRPCDRNDRLN